MRTLRSGRLSILLVVVFAATLGIVARQIYDAGTAAYVNGERLPFGSVEKTIEKLAAADPDRFEGLGGQAEEKRIRRLLVESRVELRLIGQAAAKAGVTVTEEEIDADLAAHAKSFENEAAFYEALATEGRSGRTLRDETSDILARQKMEIKLARAAKVAPNEIDHFIEGQRSNLEAPTEQILLSWVTVTSGAQGRRLLKAGRATSLAVAAKQQGLRVQNLWQQKTLLNSKVSEMMTLAGDGNLSDIVPGPDGSLSVYQITGRRTKASTGKELRRQIKDKLLRDKRESSFSQWLAEVKHASSIQILVP